MKSTEQHYAEVAYESIAKVNEENAISERYGQLCHRFPSLVLTNGLRLAVAFFEVKGNQPADPHARYLEDMRKALEIGEWKSEISKRNQNADYLHLSRKALSASVWFKRYAEAILKVEQAADAEAGAGES